MVLEPMTVEARAALHRALADVSRLRIVDALQLSDRSPTELRELAGIPANLLAFHLDVLEGAGLIARTPSEGDARRRYVTLVAGRLEHLAAPPQLPGGTERVLFVCTANSARSQLAAHLWQARTGQPALSAGREPAPKVHPLAVRVARRHGLDLRGARPRGYAELDLAPDLVVSVCDRANETDATFSAPRLHWSVPDPVPGDHEDFVRAFELLSDRVDRLARALPPNTDPGRNIAGPDDLDPDPSRGPLERS
jgi:ArsR family transcriptional regulator, arsenate/arsenite/antimonite-responsive transcriptional repressor / arsenate reductase (thioredoxin)